MGLKEQGQTEITPEDKPYFHPIKKYKTSSEKDLPIESMLLQKIQIQPGNNGGLLFN